MKIVVILGPTGVGKTKLSIALAKTLKGEIINADGTQLFKEANIGTAKVTKEEMDGVVHHMLDIVSLKDNYTVKDYQSDARIILDSLIKENKNVVIVGGTGLYIKAHLNDNIFREEEGKYDSYDELTNEELKEKVNSIYEGNDIHQNNRKRLIRFLNHYNKTVEIIKNNEGKDTRVYDFTLIGLTAPKEELYEYLNKRVEIMMCDGFIEEARNLYNEGLTKAENLIGYKEFIEYFKGNMELVDAVESIKRRTRKYAKRQYTWINNQFEDVKWFEINYKNFDETIKKVEDYLNSL